MTEFGGYTEEEDEVHVARFVAGDDARQIAAVVGRSAASAQLRTSRLSLVDRIGSAARERIVERHVEGWTVSRIARQHGVKPPVVERLLRKAGLEPRLRPAAAAWIPGDMHPETGAYGRIVPTFGDGKAEDPLKVVLRHWPIAREDEVEIGPIENDGANPPRYYIPLAGGWEIQTKGSGSTFRLGNSVTKRQIALTTAGYDAAHLEMMAREVNAVTCAMQNEIVSLRARLAEIEGRAAA
ncbi:hypothetical protein [Aurantimonas sp. VKM B-3413]|uniref:hypothetical protein n=1 Tax=Aurantimonas sp. VKM B-3413 TaxID=2779401 RepID=UPI001E43CAEC|nr:hypothetical protein [Aurantimonas sp. VKM B-3413]MCB8840197.1 hypothetical protein [Aurantimonas sp. VKM B-3413]